MKKWTIFFILHAIDKELVHHSKALIKLLEKTQWNLGQINVVYLYNGYLSKRNPSGKKIINARLFKIEESGASYRSHQLKNYGSINIGSTINLTNIFSDVNEQFPSERFMLFTWDHGSGFGVWEADPELEFSNLFGSITNLEKHIGDKENNFRFRIVSNTLVQGNDFFNAEHNLNKLKRSKEQINTDAIFPGKFEVIDFSGSSSEQTDILTNDELSRAITNGLNRKVDVLIMVNCFMQMVETGFSLRDCVQYLVACETGFWAYGFDYQSIFDQLYDNPDLSSEEIARQFIKTIENPYRRIRQPELLNDVVASACNLQYSNDLADVIDEFVRIVNSDADRFYVLLKAARKKTTEISGLIFESEEIPLPYPLFIIDLVYLLHLLSNENARIAQLFSKLQSRVMEGKYLLARRVGIDFETEHSSIEKINGFSIYFPQYKTDANRDYHRYFYTHDSKFEIEFSKKRLWSQFLPVYLNFK